jgi:hypothetical protein
MRARPKAEFAPFAHQGELDKRYLLEWREHAQHGRETRDHRTRQCEGSRNGPAVEEASGQNKTGIREYGREEHGAELWKEKEAIAYQLM